MIELLKLADEISVVGRGIAQNNFPQWAQQLFETAVELRRIAAQPAAGFVVDGHCAFSGCVYKQFGSPPFRTDASHGPLIPPNHVAAADEKYLHITLDTELYAHILTSHQPETEMNVTITSSKHDKVLTIVAMRDQHDNVLTEQTETANRAAYVQVCQDGKQVNVITYAAARTAIENARKAGMTVVGA